VRAELGHLPCRVADDRERAQRAEDAADAERVGDRRPDPVAGRDLEVAERRLVPADLDGEDDVVRALERLPPLERPDQARLRCSAI
jgi:hypothetical protein